MKKYNILVLVIIFILGLILFRKNVFKSNDKIIEQITNSNVDDTDEYIKSPEHHFCDSHKGNNDALEKDCNVLTNNKCNSTSCCVWVNAGNKKGGKCFAGSQDGPTFKTDDNGDLITFDTYYYKNKQYNK